MLYVPKHAHAVVLEHPRTRLVRGVLKPVKSVQSEITMLDDLGRDVDIFLVDRQRGPERAPMKTLTDQHEVKHLFIVPAENQPGPAPVRHR